MFVEISAHSFTVYPIFSKNGRKNFENLTTNFKIAIVVEWQTEDKITEAERISAA